MSGQPTVLRLPPYIAIVGAAITVLAAAILAMGFAGGMRPGSNGFIPWLMLVCAFAVGGLYSLTLSLSWRLAFDDDGLSLRGPLWRYGPVLSWPAIERIEAGGGSLTIRGAGRIIKSPLAIPGLDDLLAIAAMHGNQDASRLLADPNRRPGKDFF
jgi:hypothetical protein